MVPELSEYKKAFVLMHDPIPREEGGLCVGMKLNSDEVYKRDSRNKTVWDCFVPGTRFSKSGGLYEVQQNKNRLELVWIGGKKEPNPNRSKPIACKGDRPRGINTRKAIMKFLRTIENDELPTLRTIGNEIGLTGLTPIQMQLTKLVERGHLEITRRATGKGRYFKILKEMEE